MSYYLLVRKKGLFRGFCPFDLWGIEGHFGLYSQCCTVSKIVLHVSMIWGYKWYQMVLQNPINRIITFITTSRKYFLNLSVFLYQLRFRSVIRIYRALEKVALKSKSRRGSRGSYGYFSVRLTKIGYKCFQ